MAEPPAYARHREGMQPPYLYPDYASTVKRAPTRKLIRIDHTLSEITAPSFSTDWAGPAATDLTKQRLPTPSSSSGNATPPAATTTRSTSTTPRSTRISPAPGKPSPTTTAATGS
jgi:hypothetical protein